MTKKQVPSRVRTQGLKDKKFAQTLVKNNFNGTKTVEQLMNPGSKHNATSMAVQKIGQRGMQKALEDVLADQGMDEQEISRILQRNARQTKNLSASNTSVDMMIKVRGDYAPTKSVSISASLSPEERKRKVKDLEQEFKELTTNPPKK